jgi:hypothetical protein
VTEQYAGFQNKDLDLQIQRPLLPVLGHEAALTQCVANLLSNAIKFVHQAEPLGLKSGPKGGRRRSRHPPARRKMLKRALPEFASGSKTTALALPRQIFSGFSACSSASTRRTNMKAPASVSLSCEKPLNEWVAKSALNHAWVRAARFGWN